MLLFLFLLSNCRQIDIKVKQKVIKAKETNKQIKPTTISQVKQKKIQSEINETRENRNSFETSFKPTWHHGSRNRNLGVIQNSVIFN